MQYLLWAQNAERWAASDGLNNRIRQSEMAFWCEASKQHPCCPFSWSRYSWVLFSVSQVRTGNRKGQGSVGKERQAKKIYLFVVGQVHLSFFFLTPFPRYPQCTSCSSHRPVPITLVNSLDRVGKGFGTHSTQ